MYSFDFKVLLGFCRYFFAFYFPKKKDRKSSIPIQMVCHYSPYCMFIDKQRILKKIIKGMNRASRHGSVDGRLQCIFL